MKISNLKKRINSFKYAFRGIIDLMTTQTNAQIHLCITFLVLLFGIYFNLSHLEWILIIFAIALVFSAEAFNTAIEYLTDLVSPEYHPLAGKAKDVAAGAVLLTAIGAALIGILIFLPKICNIWGHF